MSEQNQRQRVIQELATLDAVSVENPAHPGTPDVNFIDGWLELKYADEWPARESSPLPLKHFTKQQRVWIYRRHFRGGWIAVLLQVGREWLMVPPEWAVRHLGKEATRQDIIDNSLIHWPQGWKKGELLKWVLESQEALAKSRTPKS